ncbi:MAG: DUF3192 domain-containing protein [Candidatus Omnitrophota bacterium]
MRKSFSFVLLLGMFGVFLAGCAALYEEYEVPSADPDPAVRRFVSLHQLQRGLARSEVKALLGEQVIIGYERADRNEQRYKPITRQNPYRIEEIDKNGKKYVVDYYLIGINTSDGQVTDDELSPLIFKDGQLAGWGWEFLGKIKE